MTVRLLTQRIANRTATIVFAIALAAIGCTPTPKIKPPSTAPATLPSTEAEPDKTNVVVGNPTWFESLGAPRRLTMDEAKFLLGRASAKLSGKPIEASVPASLQDDHDKRLVFLSTCDGVAVARTYIAGGDGVLAATDAALAAAVEAKSARWIQIDVVTDVRPSEAKWPGAALGLRHGEGLAYAAPSHTALLPEQLSALGVLTSEGRVKPGMLPTEETRLADAADASRQRFLFQTDAFYLDEDRVLPVRRDEWMDPKAPATAEDLTEAYVLAGHYLSRAVEPDGRFIYQYVPSAGAGDNEYNIVRHAGAIFGIIESYNAGGRRDPSMLAAAKRALLYLRKNISDDPRIQGAAAIVEADRASLGGNAVGILSISAYTAASGDKEFLNDALRLAKWISATQNQAGKFTVHSQMFSTGDVLSSSLPYFPGEAVFGLCRLSDLDPNGPWLDVAARGLQYMIANNDPEIDMTKVYEDHWLLYAAENVHARKADPRYIAHAKRMVDTITATQKFTDARRPAWNGAYTFPPNANQTATRVEGLCAAYRLFDSVGDRAHSELIRRSIEAACRFQLRQQFRVPEAIRYRNAMHLAGGFQNAPDDPRIRIDTVQHNISSLVGVRNILFPTAPTTAK